MQKTIVPCLIFVPCFIAFMLRILGSSIHIKLKPFRININTLQDKWNKTE